MLLSEFLPGATNGQIMNLVMKWDNGSSERDIIRRFLNELDEFTDELYEHMSRCANETKVMVFYTHPLCDKKKFILTMKTPNVKLLLDHSDESMDSFLLQYFAMNRPESISHDNVVNAIKNGLIMTIQHIASEDELYLALYSLVRKCSDNISHIIILISGIKNENHRRGLFFWTARYNRLDLLDMILSCFDNILHIEHYKYFEKVKPIIQIFNKHIGINGDESIYSQCTETAPSPSSHVAIQ